MSAEASQQAVAVIPPARRRPPREKVIEAHLLKRCREVGFLCLKFTSPARGGVPDRVIITPTAGTVFVELKRPGGSAEARQLAVHEKMRRHGAAVYIADTTSAVDELVAELLSGSRA